MYVCLCMYICMSKYVCIYVCMYVLVSHLQSLQLRSLALDLGLCDQLLRSLRGRASGHLLAQAAVRVHFSLFYFTIHT